MEQVWVGKPAQAGQRALRWLRPGLAWLFALAEADSAPPGGARARDAEPDSASPDPTEGYDDFVREHERAILNYLWRLTGDEQSAYDLTQEVFLRAWKQFARLQAYEKPEGWLFRVATNLGLSALARRRTQASEAALSMAREPEMGDLAARLAERDQVRTTLLRLTPLRRAALCLREVYGLSCAEVAKALGVSETAARMTLSRAREQFRELYLREEGNPHDA